MITARAWAGKRYAVLGLARSGTATVRALVASGASVVAWDADEARRDAILPGTGRWQAKPDGGGSELGDAPGTTPPPPAAPVPLPASGEDLTIADLSTLDLTQFDALILSPGVPLNTHPLAAAARAAGTPIIGDIELFAQARAELPPHKVVGITGTNGKSTTTALVTHILKTAGVPALMGGNIGVPILSQDPLPEGGVYVLELSSYQIDLTQTLDCDVAVLLNITPDHLDRYDGSFEAYAASKARLFEMQSAEHVAFVNWDDFMAGRVTPNGMFNGINLLKSARQANWLALQGPHNLQNASAAYEICSILTVDVDPKTADHEVYGPEEISPVLIEEALRHLPRPSPPHGAHRHARRRDLVRRFQGDQPESTAPALAAFPRVHWILGGRAKGGDLDACLPHLNHVAHAYTIGEAGPVFARVPPAARRRHRIRDARSSGQKRSDERPTRRGRPALARGGELRSVPRLRASRAGLP